MVKKVKARKINEIRKGLLIGINYVGTGNALNGCINDTQNLAKFMIQNNYLTRGEMTFMTDYDSGELYPTKANIIRQFKKIVKFANSHPDDQILLFIAYSGHGTYLRDDNGDEADRRDEALCPVDCDKNGYIRDDYIKIEFADKLPSNCRLFMMIDACHSGTMMDFKYSYEFGRRDTTVNVHNDTDTECTAVMISGCHDRQTSADAFIAGTYQGAMTAAFIANYRDGITYDKLIRNMRDHLRKKKYTQIPQLSSSIKVDPKSETLLSTF